MAKAGRISGKECKPAAPRACEVKVAVGIAAEWAREQGSANAARLETIAQTLERGGSVSEAAAEREIAAWARTTLRDPEAPKRAREWAETLSEALHLRIV